MMFAAAALAVLIAMALVLARALLGPTIYDRILALNSFGTKTVLIIAVYGFLTGKQIVATPPLASPARVDSAPSQGRPRDLSRMNEFCRDYLQFPGLASVASMYVIDSIPYSASGKKFAPL